MAILKKKQPQIGFQDQLSLNADKKYCRKLQGAFCNTLDLQPGRVAQSVTCLATDGSLTAYPGVAGSIPALSHTFMEIDHEIISTVIHLPSAESFKKGCCQS